MSFQTIKKLVAAQFEAMQKLGTLLQVDSNRDDIWEAYLNNFQQQVQQEHNCNCCKSFIRQVGSVVIITPQLQLVSIWDIEADAIPDEFQASIKALSDYVHSRPIKSLFQVCDKEAGKDSNFSEKHQVVFQHFYVKLPASATASNTAAKSGELRESANVFRRGMEEIADASIQVVLELIAQNSLYRGADYKHMLEGMQASKASYADIAEENRELFCWFVALTKPASEVRVRNTAIGTLLTDLSEGKELEVAVKAFERIMTPANYKRPTALVTPRMVEDARKTLEGLQMLSALERRRLDTRDLGPHNALFVHRGTEATKDVFSQLSEQAPVQVQSLSKCEEVSIEKFEKDILPTCKRIRLLVENRHLPNFATLTGAVDPDAKPIFKWNSSFGWSYTGGVADSMRERVAKLGGRVDGVLRFTHSWNWDDTKPNKSLMDLHVFMPGCKITSGSSPSCVGRRVGWNKRQDLASGGVQDLDYTNAAPTGYVPVENITFPSIAKMPEGVYRCAIHNWALRDPTKSGFRAEIECGGQIYQYQWDKPLKNKEWVDVALVTLKDGQFTVESKIPTSTGSREKWGITTNQWRTVKAVTLSPNHWEKPTGNKHWFFMLEGCVSDEATKPFLNEFLCSELDSNRKVMEVLASKITVADAEGAELSGLGFSSTVRNHVYLELEGSFRRTIKVVF